jgi:ubiquinone/menaquinone biosynthesis C-methylase UbiE
LGRGLWQGRAQLPDLRAVLDPSDRAETKNSYIDRLHRRALEHSLNLEPAQRILDLGCGVGRLSRWLAGTDRLVIGVDISDAMLRAARSRPQPNVAFVLYSGTELPFADASFDRVVSVFVLQHVIGAIALAHLVAEVARVTRTGGRVAIIEQVRRRSDAVDGYVEHRTKREYRDAFQTGGFQALGAKAIRSPAGFSALAARRLLPNATQGIAGAADRLIAGPMSLLTYSDCLMSFEKSAAF